MNAAPGEMPSHSVELPSKLSEQVLGAAAEELITTGIQHSTIAGVASLAGVPEDAVSQRWNSVEALVVAVVRRDLDSRLAEITPALRSRDRLDDRIADVFTSVLWFLDSHPLVGGAIRSDAGMILPTAAVSISRTVEHGVAAIVDRISTAVSQAAGRSIDADALTELLTRLTQSLLLTRGASTPLRSRSDLAGYAHQCIVPLVRAFLR